MAPPANRIELSLTITSDTLLPDQISDLVGNLPTSSQTKGQSRTRDAPPFRKNSWTVEFGTSSDSELGSLKASCFRFLSSHQSALRQVTTRTDVEAFLTFYIRTGIYHVGLELSVEETQLLAATHIFPTFSIYPGE